MTGNQPIPEQTTNQSEHQTVTGSWCFTSGLEIESLEFLLRLLGGSTVPGTAVSVGVTAAAAAVVAVVTAAANATLGRERDLS